MLDTTEEILADIEQTLEQLTQNAKVLQEAKSAHHFVHEVNQLERLQESLLARLLHRQSLLQMDKKKKVLESIKKEAIEQKIVEYAKFSQPKRPASGPLPTFKNKNLRDKRRSKATTFARRKSK